ncbi:MAG: PQQ-binding-like beta-propeller repeat protein [Candidatus Bathyarchaeales archaeon]
MGKNKIAMVMALISAITFAFTLTVLPTVSAQSSGEKTSYAYIFAAPNPVGVGQKVYISMLIDLPLPDSNVDNDIRRHGYTLTITKPDGKTEKFEWAVVQDTTGVEFLSYVPDQVGIYTLKFDYAGQVYTWNATATQRAWTGVRFLPATRTITLTVQAEKIPDPIGSYPLPTEYWTRPIEGQNTVWYTIASNWLGGEHFGRFYVQTGYNLWQQSGTGPESPHILWTKPIEFGGVVGGNTAIPGETYYSGGSYEGRFVNSIIMHGRLYYQLPLGHSGSGGGYACVDLRTGDEIWYRADLGVTGSPAPSKGQIYSFESQNQHGAGGGILWQINGTSWNAIDPFSGKWMYTLTNVPSGTEVYTEKGEIVRYVLNYTGRWLALWNFTASIATRAGPTDTSRDQWRPNGKTIDTSTAYSWNVTIPDLPGNAAPTIAAILPGDVILGVSSNVMPGVTRMAVTGLPYTVWAMSDKPGTRGQLIWIKTYSAPPGNLTRTLGPLDPINRVWTMTDAETMQWLGYSLDDGNLLWGPTNIQFRDIQCFASGEGFGQRAVTAYGNLYIQGYGGEIFALSAKDGKVLWKYNNTDSGLETPWGLMPIFIAAVADGKVYAFNNEHSPNTPLYKGYKIYCIDAFTGEEIFRLTGWAGQTGGRGTSTSVLAEGILAYYNYYDNQIYALGKGPSATSVTASPKVSVHGSKVLVEGTVIDISAGTKQAEQAARFPNGVPVVSDESMSAWMEYVYMQKPKPTDVKGVLVTVTVLDPNGNCYDVATATTNTNGFFSATFTPPVPGKYTVIATFQGSKAYWGSSAETAIFVEEAPPPTPATTPLPQEPVGTYFAVSTVAIIAAVVLVGLLILRKR